MKVFIITAVTTAILMSLLCTVGFHAVFIVSIFLAYGFFSMT